MTLIATGPSRVNAELQPTHRARPLPKLAPMPVFRPMMPVPAPALKPSPQTCEITHTGRRRRRGVRGRGGRGSRSWNATDPVVREHWETRLGRILELLKTQKRCHLCERQLKFNGSKRAFPVLSQRLDRLLCRGCCHDVKECGPDTDTTPTRAEHMAIEFLAMQAHWGQEKFHRLAKALLPAEVRARVDVVKRRRAHVLRMHRHGYKIGTIARLLDVNGSHVANDLQKLGLTEAKRAPVQEPSPVAPGVPALAEPGVERVLPDYRIGENEVVMSVPALLPVVPVVPEIISPAEVPAQLPVVEVVENGVACDGQQTELSAGKGNGRRRPPTPEEIGAECAAIQATWKPRQREVRERGLHDSQTGIVAARRARVKQLHDQGVPHWFIASAVGVERKTVVHDLSVVRASARSKPAKEAQPNEVPA